MNSNPNTTLLREQPLEEEAEEGKMDPLIEAAVQQITKYQASIHNLDSLI